MKVRNSILIAVLLAAGVFAATKGDTPAAKYGATQVKGYDGGVASATAIPMLNGENTIAVYNNGILDGGTSQKIFCGWDSAVSPTTGMPVAVGVLLNIDIVSVCNSPIPNDGGATVCNPQLYCVANNSAQFSEMDVRSLKVK